jgi:hypothetical protein
MEQDIGGVGTKEKQLLTPQQTPMLLVIVMQAQH